MPTLREQSHMGLGETDNVRRVSINAAGDVGSSPRVGSSPLNIPSEYAQWHELTIHPGNGEPTPRRPHIFASSGWKGFS